MTFGTVSVVVPPEAVGEIVVMTMVERISFSTAPASPGLVGTGLGFDISLSRDIQPLKEATVTIGYGDSLPAWVNPSRLVLARYVEGAGIYVPLVTTVDTAAKTLMAKLNHFSTFQVMQRSPSDTVSTVKVFPNPFRPKLGHAAVTFSDLPALTRVRLYTVAGEKVQDLATNAAGMAAWDGKNLSGANAASGVYYGFAESGTQRKTFKVVVER
ncbi:MAG: hypothetical protein HY748_05450 [Elusimicrobia bacterium]|nr:hypothetical protein [Elusimicrobiota bacterium]